MEEINYCIEILNLFENNEYTNSYILQEINRRKYPELVIHLDEIKLEKDTVLPRDIYGSGYIGYFNIQWYQKMHTLYVTLLQKKISEGNESYRYDYSSLSYIHRLEQLFINENLNEEHMLKYILQVNMDIGRKHLFIHLLEYMKDRKKWSEMEYYIEQMPVYKADSYQKNDQPTSAQGYQIRIYEFIEKVDLKKFNEYFKKCLPSIHRYEMKEIKSEFISNYSQQKGVDEAMILTQRAPFKNFEIDCLYPQTEILSYPEMATLLHTYKEILDKQKSNIQEILLVGTLQAEFKKGHYNEQYFLEMFEDLKKLNREERWGDCKLKDALFFDLAESTTNYTFIVNCRKEIKNNSLKSELKPWELENKKEKK